MIRFKFVYPRNYKIIEALYNKKYAEGLEICMILFNFVHIFKRVTPSKSKFFRIFPFVKKRGFNRFSKEDTSDFRSMCKDFGWSYVTSTDLFDVFYSEDLLNSKDIFGPGEERQALQDSFSYSNKFVAFAFILCFSFLFNFFKDLVGTPDFYRTNLRVILLSLLILGFMFAIADLSKTFIFRTINKEAWNNTNKKIKYFDYSNDLGDIIRFISPFTIIFLQFYIIGANYNFPIVFIFIYFLSYLLRRRIEEKPYMNESAKTVVYIVLSICLVLPLFIIGPYLVNDPTYNDNIPLDYPVLTDNKNDKRSFIKNSSVFSPLNYNYFEYYETISNISSNNLSTNYFRARNQWVLDKYLEAIFKEMSKVSATYTNNKIIYPDFYSETLDPSIWNVHKAYLLPRNHLILIKDLEVWTLYSKEDILGKEMEEKIKELISESEKKLS